MTFKRKVALLGSLSLLLGVVAGCSGGGGGAASGGGDTSGGKPAADGGKAAETAKEDTTPLAVTIGLKQVNDIPNKGNEVEQAIEKYTNTKLDIQWIPSAAFDEKINVMIASNELPKILMVNYVPTVISAIESDIFWEIGPYLKDYKNLSAQNPQFYENVKVGGKLYSIPQFRNIGRIAYVYRQDLFDKYNLKEPQTLDEWYNVIKTISQNNMDAGGKINVYGTMLDKSNIANTLTRLAVSQGAPNKWAVKDGKFTPEHMTQEYVDTLKLFRRLFEEKLINQDFPAFDGSELDKMMDSGRVGLKISAVATNAPNIEDRLKKNVPTGVMNAGLFAGPSGPRIAGDNGHNGMLVIPKSSVKTEAELKRILAFMDKLMDEPMSTLQLRGIEGKHYKKADDGQVEWLDLTAFNREVKPYRDDLLNVELYNVPVLKESPLGQKTRKMEIDNIKYAVPNPAKTLTSAIFSERGKELETMIDDAKTKFIMGKIDEAGWNAEVENWRKAGGDQLIKEYEEAYAKAGGK